MGKIGRGKSGGLKYIYNCIVLSLFLVFSSRATGYEEKNDLIVYRPTVMPFSEILFEIEDNFVLGT